MNLRPSENEKAYTKIPGQQYHLSGCSFKCLVSEFSFALESKLHVKFYLQYIFSNYGEIMQNR